MGNTVSPGAPESTGNASANIPDTSVECDNRSASGLTQDSIQTFSWYAKRQVIDLKQLNTHILTSQFCMHTISSVLSTVRKGDYVFKIYLQDVYFHVLIHPDSRMYLHFAFKNKVYQFQVIPFGLNTAPHLFTPIGHTVAAYLHLQGILVIPYLDDSLVHHPDH